MNERLPRGGREAADRGSALVVAIFVLVLLTGMGTALLFLSQQESRMSKAGLRSKQAFYMAEAAIEDGRTTLFATNGVNPFVDDLHAAAGTNDIIDFDPTAIQATYAPDGTVTGFTGFGDDVPLRGVTSLGGPGNPGWYAAFLTNDPLDGPTSFTDSNNRIMVTGIGAGNGRSFEVVQAILEPLHFLPDVPAAAMTLLGPDPHFNNDPSVPQSYTGNDCGVPGAPYAPVVGAVGSDASADVESGIINPENFTSGPYEGGDTIGDLTDPTDPIVADSPGGTIDPQWLECEEMKELVEFLVLAADYYCNADVDSCTFPATTLDSVVVIDGDMPSTPAGSYTGILLVTGSLTYKGNTGWDGIILVIGEGKLIRSGGGTGDPSGAVIVANIDPTPDGPATDRSDWCTTPPDGYGEAWYDASGGGNSSVQWCTAFIELANTVRSYRVAEFLQR